MRRIKNKIKLLYKNFRIFMKLIVGKKSTYKISLFKKIKMNIKGFTSDQYVQYNFKENSIDEYISEFERWKSRGINGRYNLVLDDKLIFEEVGKYVNIPKNLGLIKNGVIYDLNGHCLSDEEFILLLQNNNQKVFVKPSYGSGGGRGVYTIRDIENNIYIGNNLVNMKDIKNLNDYIIVEFVKQHDYSNKLFGKTTNTIRLVTVLNSNDGTASVISALHRIGVEASIPVDNFSRGGLASKIDIEVGIIKNAKTKFDTKEHSHHPDTGAQINGVKIPITLWNLVKEKTIEVAQKFPYIPFMAWDILITDSSFSVIEINASTDIDIFQMWQGERNTKLGEFYKEQNIIK